MMGLAKFDPKKRFFTINRSYSPGMSRLGAVIWTGDISVSWDSLGQQPGYVLNWHMAGVGFVTCDSGGFNGNNDTPLLLTRWYQYAAFMPVMRVHSSINNLPHFPFLYGEAAGDAMRKALNMRYQLVPYHCECAATPLPLRPPMVGTLEIGAFGERRFFGALRSNCACLQTLSRTPPTRPARLAMASR